MADHVPKLVNTTDLKAEYLNRIAQKKERAPLLLRYDSLSDTLILLLISPKIETVVHHIDKYGSLLYRPDTMDIVGIQIEDFEHSFLPKHDEVRRVWRFRKTIDEWPENIVDLEIIVQKMKPKMAREIVRAAEPTLEQLGLPTESLNHALEPEMA